MLGRDTKAVLQRLTLDGRQAGIGGIDKAQFVPQTVQRLHYPPHHRVLLPHHILQFTSVEREKIQHTHIKFGQLEQAIPAGTA